MEIQCIERDIRQVLESRAHVILRFQRPYSWDKQKVENFWVDVRNTFHFTSAGFSIRCFLIVASLLTALPAMAKNELRGDWHERVLQIPVTVKDRNGWERQRNMIVTVFSPSGPGPFPIAVVSHGRDAEESDRASKARIRFLGATDFFIRRGFIVIVPTRIGYGNTGTDFDPEETGRCEGANYSPMLIAATTQILAALNYGRSLPEADPNRAILVGVSVGGISTVAAAATNPAGLVAAINFSGGDGGDPISHPGNPCNTKQLDLIYQRFGKFVRMPMLWLYGENDKLFSSFHSDRWAKLYVEGGAPLEYRLLPNVGKDGHHLFSRRDIWTPEVDRFMQKLGFHETPSPIDLSVEKDANSPVRTLYEIQQGFDKSASSFLHLFQQQRRLDHETTGGKLLLSLTVEPDGSVSDSHVESKTISCGNASCADFEKQIVNQIKQINFGARPVSEFTYYGYPIAFTADPL